MIKHFFTLPPGHKNLHLCVVSACAPPIVFMISIAWWRCSYTMQIATQYQCNSSDTQLYHTAVSTLRDWLKIKILSIVAMIRYWIISKNMTLCKEIRVRSQRQRLPSGALFARTSFQSVRAKSGNLDQRAWVDQILARDWFLQTFRVSDWLRGFKLEKKSCFPHFLASPHTPGYLWFLF